MRVIVHHPAHSFAGREYFRFSHGRHIRSGLREQVPAGTGDGTYRVGHTGLAVHAEPTPAGVSVRALFDCLCPVLPGFATAPVFEF